MTVLKRIFKITSPRRDVPYSADEQDMRELLGVTGPRWPKEGVAKQGLDGKCVRVLRDEGTGQKKLEVTPVMIQVWVIPYEQGTGRSKRSGKERFIRTLCGCPGCQLTVPVGRLQQHNCDSKRARNARARNIV